MAKKNKFRNIKNFFSVIFFALGVLILTVSLINITNENIAGRVSYDKIVVYGKVAPSLPDGTKITFKVGNLDIASTVLENEEYPKTSFKLDDPTTIPVEGYAPGNIVDVYIAGIKTAELSYFKYLNNKKDINIPASKRVEIATAAANYIINESCVPNWQCSKWSECVDGQQIRVCNDLNKCGNEKNKPIEKRSCRVLEVEQPMPTKIDKGLWIIAIFIIFVIAFIVSVTRRAKNISEND